ncbi:hypothetical protein LSUE1_G003574 [Lachnellula suecica]|uniref:Uncharacterized protein n=1 Tax=Lachnellula suecica TaxID=602035 RepID=A0A8T9C8E0_9HELO|nr:hypothetical protein LSUE1_G003574 [Lachnellula suecica]
MQFSITTFTFVALATFAQADVHSSALCVDMNNGYAVYNDTATIAACTAYLARNNGADQWESCPDCVMATDPAPHCQSDAWHIGGDQVMTP